MDIIWRYHTWISYGESYGDVINRSFMVSVALWWELLKKRQLAKPRMSLFEDRLLSHSDTGFRIYVKNWLDWYQGHVLKRFLRRAVARQR